MTARRPANLSRPVVFLLGELTVLTVLYVPRLVVAAVLQKRVRLL